MSAGGYWARVRRIWIRHRRYLIALGIVPILLILAVVGAGWNTVFEPIERNGTGSDTVVSLESGNSDLHLFLIFGFVVMIGLLALLLKNNGWSAIATIVLLGIAFALAGLIGGVLDRGESPASPSPGTGDDSVRDVVEAGSPGLRLAWILTGVAVVGSLIIARRRDGEVIDNDDEDDHEAAEAVAEIAARLDLAPGLPRENIIAMYAALEFELAKHSNGRQVSETTAEFSGRVLAHLGATGVACAELADLYQGIGFGERDATSSDQSSAVLLLRSISRDLGPSRPGVSTVVDDRA